jgi:hypothetical protein
MQQQPGETLERLRPLLQAEWSNGIFVSSGGIAGWHLSQTAGVEYGPAAGIHQLARTARRPAFARFACHSRFAGCGRTFNYYLGEDARLRSSILYDTSAHGFRGDVGVQRS